MINQNDYQRNFHITARSSHQTPDRKVVVISRCRANIVSGF